MFWAMGQKIMKAARVVKERKNLFGVYVTNFSCGPDSFLLGYFRDLMQSKPSLTLELDQHTADAGIDTRIEAALDIMRRYHAGERAAEEEPVFAPAGVITDPRPTVVSSSGEKYALTDPQVEIVLPSMGYYGTTALAAVFRGIGVHARALPVADETVLQQGRKNATCKECLPYLITTGSFLTYLRNRKETDKVTLCFLATGGGPCRLGQYCRAFDSVIRKHEIPNAAVFAMTDENGYGGMGTASLLKAYQGVVVSDVFGDIRSMLTVAAVDPQQALSELNECWNEVLDYFEARLSVRFTLLLQWIARRLSRIPLKRDPRDVPVVSLVGEIFVRRDEFARKNVVEYLESHGFMVRVAPVAEYMCYSNYVVNNGLGERKFGFGESMKMKLRERVQEWWERRIKDTLALSGVYKSEMIDVDTTISGVKHLLNENFRGECILTVGLAMREILEDSSGVISIGPFGCMYSRMAEAMLNKEMTVVGKKRMPDKGELAAQFEDVGTLPFLSLESDGGAFPQLVEAKLEAFVLQARRVHERLESRDRHAPEKPERSLLTLLGAGRRRG
jgi:predicted nucleotide-binding protein (sugar kinase/HSP70/actin superfamily)